MFEFVEYRILELPLIGESGLLSFGGMTLVLIAVGFWVFMKLIRCLMGETEDAGLSISLILVGVKLLVFMCRDTYGVYVLWWIGVFEIWTGLYSVTVSILTSNRGGFY